MEGIKVWRNYKRVGKIVKEIKMKEVKLSAGKESFSEIKKYLESNKNLNYSLSIYD